MTELSRDPPPIVVGVNGTRAGLVAVDLAAAEAAVRRAPLLIVHAWPGRYLWPPPGSACPAGEGAGRRLLAVAASHAAAGAPGVPISTELTAGPAAEALVRCSGQARLLVIGHRDVQLRRADWGATAIRLTRDCGCPLLVHRGRMPQHGPVVVAVSGRASPDAALDFALEEAALWGAGVVAVHLCDRAPTDAAPGRPHRPADHRLAGVVAATRRDRREVPVERMVVPAPDLAYTVDRAARRARLLVAGAGHHGRVAALINIRLRPAPARRTLCPVVLVPSEGGWT